MPSTNPVIQEGVMSYTAGELRYAIKREANDKDSDHHHDIAWAGSMHGPYSIDGRNFSSMLDQLDD